MSQPPLATTGAGPNPRVTALQAMTISTTAPDALHALFVAGLGWQPFAEHAIDAGVEALWGLAPGSAGRGHAEVIGELPGGPDRPSGCPPAG